MKNNAILFFLFISLCLPLSVLGQDSAKMGTIKGKVVDAKDNTAIPYATVKIGRLPMYVEVIKALATNQQGEFEIKLPPDNYSLMISSMGHKELMLMKTIREAGEVVDLGVIKLQEDAVHLQEVTVKPLVTASSSEIVYNLDQDPDRETSSLHQLIDKVPMIKRTPDNKLYVGEPGSSFIVVRNGKIDALFSGKESIDEVLKSLPAKGFSSVTVQLMPDSRYGNNKYVVSIETDKTTRLIGIINMNHDAYDASKGELSLLSDFLSSYDKLRIHAGGMFANTNTPKSKSTLYQEWKETNTSIQQKGKEYTSGEKYLTSGMFSYDLGKQHFVTGYLGYKNSRERDKKELQTSQFENNVTINYGVDTRNTRRSYQPFGGLNYQYDFSKPNKILNVLYDFSYTPGKIRTDVNGDENAADIAPEVSGKTKENQHTIQAHYTDPLSSKIRMEAGLSYVFRNYLTQSGYYDQQGNRMAELSYDMESAKHIVSNYINLRYRSQKWSAEIKVKTEYLDDGDGTRVVSGKNPAQYVSESGLHITPQASVSWMFRDKFIQRTSLSYRWDKIRPNITMMTSFIDYSNPNYLFVGNPYLDPEDIHRIGLSFNTKTNLSLSLSGIYSDNKIASYWYTDEQDRLVTSFANYESYKSVSLSTNYSLRTKKLHILFMGNQSYSIRKSANNQQVENYTIIANVSTGMPVAKNIHVSLNAGYAQRFFKGMENIKQDPFNISLTTQFKCFKERLEAEVKLLNITRFRNKSEREIDTFNIYSHQINKTNAIPVQIELRWRLGSFQVKPVREAHKRAIIDDISKE